MANLRPQPFSDYFEFKIHNKVAGVYEIRHKRSGRRYVGSSERVGRRLAAHLSALTYNKHHCRYLQNLWNKYPPKDFVFALLEPCKVKELLSKEQAHMGWTLPGKLLNMCSKAEAPRGFSPSAETRAKMSASLKKRMSTKEARERVSKQWKGRVFSKETLAKILATKRANGTLKTTEATKAKLRAINLGKKLSQETKDKLSKSLIGRVVSEETRRKISAANKGRHFGGRIKGKKYPITPEVRELRRKQLKAQHNDPKIRAAVSRGVKAFWQKIKSSGCKNLSEWKRRKEKLSW